MSDLLEAIARLNEHAREHSEILTLYPSALDHIIQQAYRADSFAANLTQAKEDLDRAVTVIYAAWEELRAGDGSDALLLLGEYIRDEGESR